MSRAPDALDAIVGRHPAEMDLRRDPVGWRLVIQSSADGLRTGVTAVAETRYQMTEFAAAWEKLCAGLGHGPQRCACGELSSRHRWDERSAKRRGECPDGVGRYQAAVLTPATEVSDA